MGQPTRQNVSQSELTKKGEELAEKLDNLLDEIDESSKRMRKTS